MPTPGSKHAGCSPRYPHGYVAHTAAVIVAVFALFPVVNVSQNAVNAKMSTKPSRPGRVVITPLLAAGEPNMGAGPKPVRSRTVPAGVSTVDVQDHHASALVNVASHRLARMYTTVLAGTGAVHTSAHCAAKLGAASNRYGRYAMAVSWPGVSTTARRSSTTCSTVL
jgi:hypothetical protein